MSSNIGIDMLDGEMRKQGVIRLIDYYLLSNKWKAPKAVVYGIVIFYNIILLELTARWA